MDLERLRREYETTGFDRDALAATWHEQLVRWLDDAVAAQLPEPSAMVLATASRDGQVSSRTVLMRQLDADGIVWFTNYESDKAIALADNPRASATVPWIGLLRQVHLRGPVEPTTTNESDAYWAGRPRGSQLAAWTSPQSQVLADRVTLERTYAEMEARFDGESVPRPDNWGGYRLRPEVVEFWQGREQRLHDRLRFGHDDSDAWRVVRLWP